MMIAAILALLAISAPTSIVTATGTGPCGLVEMVEPLHACYVDGDLMRWTGDEGSAESTPNDFGCFAPMPSLLPGPYLLKFEGRTAGVCATSPVVGVQIQIKPIFADGFESGDTSKWRTK